MDEVIHVKVCEGKGYVVAEVYLDVVGQRILCLLEKVCEAFVHQLHEEHRQASVRIPEGP